MDEEARNKWMMTRDDPPPATYGDLSWRSQAKGDDRPETSLDELMSM